MGFFKDAWDAIAGQYKYQKFDPSGYRDRLRISDTEVSEGLGLVNPAIQTGVQSEINTIRGMPGLTAGAKLSATAGAAGRGATGLSDIFSRLKIEQDRANRETEARLLGIEVGEHQAGQSQNAQNRMNLSSAFDTIEFEQDNPTVVIPRSQLLQADAQIAAQYGIE